MLITVQCPRCQWSYHVQEELLGKSMRCKNGVCGFVFPIDPPQTGNSPPRTGQQAGNVGDIIPLLSAEAPATPAGSAHISAMFEMLPSETAVESAWMAPPPVRREVPHPPAPSEGPKTPAPTPSRPHTTKAPVTKVKEPKSGPRIVESGTWDAPPVRRGQETDIAPPRPISSPPDEPELPAAPVPEEDLYTHAPRGRWARRIIIPFVLLTFSGLGVGGYFVYLWIQKAEERLVKEADQEYGLHKYNSAEGKYRQLAERYPKSEQIDRYRFRQDLSELLLKTVEVPDEIDEVLDHFKQFLDDRGKDPLLPEHGVDVGNALIKVLTTYAERVGATLTDDTPLETLTRATPILDQAKAIKQPKGATAPPWEKVKESFDRIRAGIAKLKERQGILAQLNDLLESPSYPTIVKAEKLIEQQSERFPGLKSDAKVEEILKQLYRKHLESVKYVKTSGSIPPPAKGDDNEPAIVVDALLPVGEGAPETAPPNDPVKLALVRGVLYLLSANTGEIRKVIRVGIDTTVLPVRVPAQAGTTERILVLSSDTKTLSAINTQGGTLWSYPLGTPVLGRPVVVERRAYLATYEGEIHEIELNEGKLLGRYLLGPRLLRPRLTLGGSHEPGSRRVFFPADEGCVYVLDVGKQECEQILYTRHPSGTLRGEPLVIPPEAVESKGYLVLTQTLGLDRVRMRVWEMTAKDRTLSEWTRKPGVELEGWTWFSPYHDAEKIVLLSDAGVLGLIGIRQALNHDPALFPMLPEGGLNLTSLLWPDISKRAGTRGRAQVALVQGDDLWVAAEGRMMRLRLAWSPAKGPQLVPVWGGAPPEVGSPIHASQPFEDASGKSSLILTTQPARRSCSWVTRIDDATGDVKWRRQLGLVHAREPIAISRTGKEPVWLALDQSGGLFGFDAARYPVRPGAQWLSDSKMKPVADSIAETADKTPIVLTSPDVLTSPAGAKAYGKAYVLAFPGRGLDRGIRMVVREVSAGAAGKLQAIESKVTLPTKLAGEPALVGDFLLLPLADGSLARLKVPVANPDDLDVGLAWRADRVGAEATGFVVPIGRARFVTTDGAFGLATWDWPANAPNWAARPMGRGEEPTLSIENRITGLAVVSRKPASLAVTDSSGTVTLIEVKEDGAMKPGHRWDLKGQITSGPFIDSTAGETRIGCIVDRSRLVWIDPKIDKRPDWSFQRPDKDAIVGTPQVAGDLVVIADQNGYYVGIDRKSGKPVGKGYQLGGSIAPVASPILFHKDRLLAPLSDGTMMLLGIDRLKKGR